MGNMQHAAQERADVNLVSTKDARIDDFKQKQYATQEKLYSEKTDLDRRALECNKKKLDSQERRTWIHGMSQSIHSVATMFQSAVGGMQEKQHMADANQHDLSYNSMKTTGENAYAQAQTADDLVRKCAELLASTVEVQSKMLSTVGRNAA